MIMLAMIAKVMNIFNIGINQIFSKYLNKTENKTLEYSIAGFEKLKTKDKETIENLVESVAKGFKEAESITTRVELDKENNVSIFANLVVSSDAIIKELSADLQNKIKERVKMATDLDVKEVNITVKKVAQVREQTK